MYIGIAGTTCESCQASPAYLLLFVCCFWWREAHLFFSPPQLFRGQPTAKYHPRWQTILGWAVHPGLGRLPDSDLGLQVNGLVSLPVSHHCSRNSSCFRFTTIKPIRSPYSWRKKNKKLEEEK
jgi:hypothetical protein